jgi:hypothetical protein
MVLSLFIILCSFYAAFIAEFSSFPLLNIVHFCTCTKGALFGSRSVGVLRGGTGCHFCAARTFDVGQRVALYAQGRLLTRRLETRSDGRCGTHSCSRGCSKPGA